MATNNINVYSEIFQKEEAALEYLREKSVLERTRKCHGCAREMKFLTETKMFRCTKKDCRKKSSLLKGTFFAGHVLKLHQILMMAFMWLSKTPQSSVIMMTGHSKTTVTAFFKYFRELVSDAVDLEDVKIGGPGVIVEVDETKMGKRKYHRGHRVEGVWVVGGVERTEARKVFACPVEQRDSDTLLAVIRAHVLPGSIVYTDMWKGYKRLNETGMFEHFTVNHSESFVDRETGVHTNSIEGTWRAIKDGIPNRNRVKEGMEEQLWEFIWRRINKDILWDGFVKALIEVKYF